MAAENALSSLAKWTDKVAFVHEPANRHLAPTVLLPDFSSLLKLKADEQERFIHDVFTSLQSDVTASQWDVSPFEWFIKGTTSTRSNVAEVVKSAEEALKFMKAAHQEGHKLVRDRHWIAIALLSLSDHSSPLCVCWSVLLSAPLKPDSSCSRA